MNIRQAVVFSILMSNNEGILGKHPNYLKEKLESCQMVVPEVILDSGNMAKFKAYAEKYGFDWNSERDCRIPMNQFDKVTGEALIEEVK